MASSEIFNGLSRRSLDRGSGGHDRWCGARAERTCGAREGSAGLDEHGPEGTRRRLRSGGLCAEPGHGAEAMRAQQRTGARAAGRAQALRLRADRDRRARRIFCENSECADHAVRARRRLAGGPCLAVPLRGRNVRQCRCALRGDRFRQCGRCRRQPADDGRPDSPRRGMDLQERGKFRRRSRTALYLRPFVGRALGGCAAHHRLAEGLRSAGKLHQGWRLRQRNVRSQAGSAVGALELREVHRRDRTEAERAASSRQDRGAGRGRLRNR